MAIVDRLKRDPGLAFVLLGIAAVTLAYAPVLTYGLVNYDDPWLIAENWIVRNPSLNAVVKIVGDFGQETRFVLGAEYLPVRDLSVMLDHLLWGSWYGGHHLTNLVVYVIALPVWFAALCRLGIDRRIAGLAVLIWALHPAHVESVAWLSERKGVLALLFTGLAVLGYARFRGGASARWIAAAGCAALLAVWSKAPAAFTLATLAVLELVLPRVCLLRRTLIGLAVIGVAAAVAFVPVVLVALDTAVVTSETVARGPALALGLHGFYLRLATIGMANAPSYPVSIDGPSVLDYTIGALGLVAVAVVLARRSAPLELRVAALIWIVSWFPVSRLVLPLRAVLVADRYLLVPSLGVALACAWLLVKIANARLRVAAIVTVVLACGLRTLDARSTWEESQLLWERAVTSNSHDGDAWSMYVESVAKTRPDLAFDILRAALKKARTPRLMLRKALFVLEFGKRADAVALMYQAAMGGEPRAMANLALLLLENNDLGGALDWARRATKTAPLYVVGQRSLGKVALAAGRRDEALAAFERAYKLDPFTAANRFNLALVYIDLHRTAEARPLLESCRHDLAIGARAAELLSRISR